MADPPTSVYQKALKLLHKFQDAQIFHSPTPANMDPCTWV